VEISIMTELERLAEIQRLAMLPRLEYEVQRKDAVRRLGVRVVFLDEEVARLRPPVPVQQRESLAAPALDPWPDPIEPSAVLDDLRAFVRRFVIVSEQMLIAIVLWIAFTYFFEIAETSPRLAIISPTKRCGKSRLLELLALLCLHAISTSNLTPSAIFRTIDAEHCSLFIDEADTFAVRNDELRGLLNSGHTRASAYVIRSVPFGKKEWIAKRFSTWCMIALAAIGRLPDTWVDRSIVLRMKRKLRSQSVERLTRRNIAARDKAMELQRRLTRFAQDNLEKVREGSPAPVGLANDRGEDNWEHLLAIAELAGPVWSEQARAAARALAGASDEADDSLGVRLLHDIKTIFETDTERERWGSTELCEALIKLDISPWRAMGRAQKPLTPVRLASMLSNFDVFVAKSGDFRGYVCGDFRDAFSHYVDILADQTAQAPNPPRAEHESDPAGVPDEDTSKSGESRTDTEAEGARTPLSGGMGGATVEVDIEADDPQHATR
jgi:putative DNA primase/helicase